MAPSPVQLTSTVPVMPDGVVNAGAGTVTCRIETEGVDELFAELDAHDVVDPAEPIHDMPWGSRQFSVLDCCGNRLTFVRSADPER